MTDPYVVRPAAWQEKDDRGRFTCHRCGLELVRVVIQPGARSSHGGQIEDDWLHISAGPEWHRTEYGHWSLGGRARDQYQADRRLADRAGDKRLQDQARERLSSGKWKRSSAAVERPLGLGPVHSRNQVELPALFFCRCGGRNELLPENLASLQRRLVGSA